MATEVVHYEARENVAFLRLDDGKANALSHAVIRQLHAALDRAEKEAGAVLWTGRPGRFCAGFDLATMREGPEAARDLVTAGAELLLRTFAFPRPVVVACSGHALAAGALVLLAADTRLGAAGEFKIGLNEVAIGMALPIFGVEIGRARLSRRHFTRAVLEAELYTPEAAVDAGFLDRVTPPDALLEAALQEATRLAGLSRDAFAHTKESARGAVIAGIRATLAQDMQRIAGPSGG